MTEICCAKKKKLKNVMSGGYVLIKNKNHPNSFKNGYIKRAHLIAEKTLGKPLPKASVVHHINGIRDDDRNNNLVVCENKGYHTLIHARERAYRACGNAKWRKCWVCKKYDDISNLAYFNSRQTRSHLKCANEYKRIWNLKKLGQI